MGGRAANDMADGGDRAAPIGAAAAPGSGIARQAVLPSFGPAVRRGSDDDFAHPAERELARLLTFYGVRWAYEPTTFDLRRAGGGGSAAFFTPDFYLPDHRLYIELTTMRQRLVTRKNQKLRRLRELYPEVGIKLLYRRDYQQLVDAYEPAKADPDQERIGPIVYPAAVIAARVETLADQIAADFAVSAPSWSTRSPVLVGVGQGSDRFLSALSAALTHRGVAYGQDRIELTRYDPVGDGRARVRRAPCLELSGRRVLLVEDVVSTGLSLAYLVAWLRRRGVRDVSACTLLDRAAARLVEVPIRHAGFQVSAALVAGFGLGLRRQFSELPYIAAIAPASLPRSSV
ncbi:MAG: hypoxanthine phosphoribosyltransferase [Chloroflexota bacterium]|nr:hypoxanthine phosphoribosyltransferase [Chloroflexota bacterium]